MALLSDLLEHCAPVDGKGKNLTSWRQKAPSSPFGVRSPSTCGKMCMHHMLEKRPGEVGHEREGERRSERLELARKTYISA